MGLGDDDIVAEVTDTLTRLLVGLDVTLKPPNELSGEQGNYQKLNLYLYQVVENPFTKNVPPSAVDDGTLQPPPLGLRLYYLVTPYASDPLSAQKVLGHAMRVFYDNAIIQETALTDALRLATDKLSIVLLSSKLEDLTRIWNALQTPYRLSVCYEIRVVPIDSARIQPIVRVQSRANAYTPR
jgi:hypothetical protein